MREPPHPRDEATAEEVFEPAPPTEEPPPSRSLWPWLLALLLVAVALIAAAWLATRGGDDEDQPPVAVGAVTVPRVIGLPQAAAVRRLRREHLQADVRSASGPQRRGVVSAQEPRPGATLARGGIVSLTVSSGPGTVAVPDVTGIRAAIAIRRLAAVGLRADPRVVQAAGPPGVVVGQEPAAGAQASRGDRIVLRVSRGSRGATPPPPGATTTTGETTPTTAETVDVPDVVGLRRRPAQRRLRAAGLVPRTVFVASPEPVGTVVTQRPTPGATVRRDSTVRINVSAGPKAATARPVPDVTSQEEQTAIATLEAAGFAVEVVDEPTSDPAEDGVVLFQDPPGGSRAPAGSPVTIYVGRLS